MKLKNQVCSLELSKKLKELGVEQESLFYWVENYPGVWNIRYEREKVYHTFVSAFTVAELGERLPFGVMSIHIDTRFNKDYAELKGGDWFCRNETRGKRKYIYAKTEADARAKMLIYLIENKLIKI